MQEKLILRVFLRSCRKTMTIPALFLQIFQYLIIKPLQIFSSCNMKPGTSEHCVLCGDWGSPTVIVGRKHHCKIRANWSGSVGDSLMEVVTGPYLILNRCDNWHHNLNNLLTANYMVYYSNIMFKFKLLCGDWVLPWPALVIIWSRPRWLPCVQQPKG